VPRFITLSLFFADCENCVPSGRIYPLLLGMPLSESLELTDRPETDDTDEAVDTERSRAGMAFRASEGATQGSGDPARSGGGEVVPVVAMVMLRLRVRDCQEADQKMENGGVLSSAQMLRKRCVKRRLG
jgi:hypothetical protein